MYDPRTHLLNIVFKIKNANLIKIIGWVQIGLIVVHHSLNLLFLFVKSHLKCLPRKRSTHRYRCHLHQPHQKSLAVHSNRHFFRWHHVGHHKKFISKAAENVAKNYYNSMVIRIRWGSVSVTSRWLYACVEYFQIQIHSFIFT